jgi:hypothetical protein
MEVETLLPYLKDDLSAYARAISALCERVNSLEYKVIKL